MTVAAYAKLAAYRAQGKSTYHMGTVALRVSMQYCTASMLSLRCTEEMAMMTLASCTAVTPSLCATAMCSTSQRCLQINMFVSGCTVVNASFEVLLVQEQKRTIELLFMSCYKCMFRQERLQAVACSPYLCANFVQLLLCHRRVAFVLES
jgi:hypothetical protein